MSTVEQQPEADAVDRFQPAVCPICSSRATDDFFHLPRLPIHVGMVYESAEDALQAEMGALSLSHCGHCGSVFNRSFEPEKLIFTPGYEVQLVHSTIFRQFLADLAARLVEKYNLRGKEIVDLGCGRGHFLRLLCEAGANHGLGIDPTVQQEGPVPLARGQMRLIRGLFNHAQADELDCDFASCQSVLEDVADPVSFLSTMRRILVARSGHAYLEVFNAFRAFAAGEVWSLTYEQCNYYSLESFGEAIRRAGFRIVDSGTCYGEGQYLYVEAAPGEPYLGRSALPGGASRRFDGESSLRLTRPTVIDRFSQIHAEKLTAWRGRIDDFRRRGTRTVVWGTGGKGICFLNTVGATDVFTHAVDINPDRQGRHVPGTGQRIVGPQNVPDLRPQVVVITNPLYESEIRQTVNQLNLSCEFLTI